jgi:integrase/recombinase XerD
LIRSFINYLAYEKEKYEGISYRSEKLGNEKGLSPYTINIRIRFLKCWFDVLIKEKLMFDSPVKNIKLMKVDIDVKDPLTEDEVRLLLQQPNQRQYAQYRDYVMLMLFIDSGMRVQELCALDVEDIALTTRCIHKNPTTYRQPECTLRMKISKCEGGFVRFTWNVNHPPKGKIQRKRRNITNLQNKGE